MPDINSEAEILALDKGNILGSIRDLDKQIQETLDGTKNLQIPDTYKDIYNVVVCGMGGSALGGRIIKSLTFPSALVPIEIVNGYTLPYYVGEKTLVLLSSYSGNTEETIESAHNALGVNAKIVGITTGGKLKEILEKEGKPSFIYIANSNPSSQPRMGLGYAITGAIAIFNKCGVTSVDEEALSKIPEITKKFIKNFDVDVPDSQNEAKSIAKKLYQKAIMMFASEHLYGSVYAMKNQINENSKIFSSIFELPEANHHLLEGLKFPAKAREVLSFLFFESSLYSDRIKKRYPITKDVVEKCGYPFVSYITQSQSKLDEIFEILVFGSFVSFYMAMLNGIDPSPIPWVDYFKEKLAQ